MSDEKPYTDGWTDAENERMAELRAEVSRPITNVKAHVERERARARRMTGQEREAPPWAAGAAAQQEEEAEPLARYASAPPDIRQWLDAHIAARLRGRKLPELWRDRVTRDVVLAWKREQLDDEPPQAAHPTHETNATERRGA